MSILKSYCVTSPPIAPQTLTMSKQRERTFIKEWREATPSRINPGKHMSQDELGEAIGQTGANISMLERGKINYKQDILEAIAGVVGCSAADLIERPPADPEGIYSLLKDASPEQRRQIADVARVLFKTPTEN